MNMHVKWLGLIMVVAASVVFVVGCGDQEHKEHARPTAAGGQAVAQKTCPVMTGNPIDKTIYVDHGGRRVYFCCQMCVDTFKKDPEKYLKKLDEQLKGTVPTGSDSNTESSESHEGHEHQ
jgi:YHS domain-containing protein